MNCKSTCKIISVIARSTTSKGLGVEVQVQVTHQMTTPTTTTTTTTTTATTKGTMPTKGTIPMLPHAVCEIAAMLGGKPIMRDLQEGMPSLWEHGWG